MSKLRQGVRRKVPDAIIGCRHYAEWFFPSVNKNRQADDRLIPGTVVISGILARLKDNVQARLSHIWNDQLLFSLVGDPRDAHANFP